MESVLEASCKECVFRSDRLFCNLPPEALEAFDGIKTFAVFPRASALFREGQVPKSMFVVCQGRIRLSVCSESGIRLTLKIAGPGEVLGLSASLSSTPYEVTAEALDDATVACVKRKDLVRFLRDHREACLQVVHVLSRDLHTAYDCVRSVGLGRSRRPRALRVH